MNASQRCTAFCSSIAHRWAECLLKKNHLEACQQGMPRGHANSKSNECVLVRAFRMLRPDNSQPSTFTVGVSEEKKHALGRRAAASHQATRRSLRARVRRTNARLSRHRTQRQCLARSTQQRADTVLHLPPMASRAGVRSRAAPCHPSHSLAAPCHPSHSLACGQHISRRCHRDCAA